MLRNYSQLKYLKIQFFQISCSRGFIPDCLCFPLIRSRVSSFHDLGITELRRPDGSQPHGGGASVVVVGGAAEVVRDQPALHRRAGSAGEQAEGTNRTRACLLGPSKRHA